MACFAHLFRLSNSWTECLVSKTFSPFTIRHASGWMAFDAQGFQGLESSFVRIGLVAMIERSPRRLNCQSTPTSDLTPATYFLCWQQLPTTLKSRASV